MLSMWLALGFAQAGEVRVAEHEQGPLLLVDGEPFFVQGMNWGYMPIGENYNYSLWTRDDAFIEAVLHREMSLLRAAGVNAIRQYDDIPPRWVTWIYENYGIYTMVNPLFGRYGLNIDGAWIPVTDYSDPRTREVILEQTLASVERYKDTEGVLFFLLGNENNYGLHWSSFEIEALPEDDRDDARARFLYSLWGEAVDLIHEADPSHPVAIANGDLQYLHLVAEEIPNLDLFGTNVYRGPSARDLYQRIHDELGEDVPIVYTEFGSDAYNSATEREDGQMQARMLQDQWEDIYVNAHGQAGVGNAIGGFVFQWSDGWWKYQQTENLDIHDTNASWPNGGYPDFVEGQNNMNEEWFGICAKTAPDAQGHYEVQPRPAYYTLQAVWQLDPYATDGAGITAHFDGIDPATYEPLSRAVSAEARVRQLERVRVADLRIEMDGVATSRDMAQPVFDHQESLYVDFASAPGPAFQAEASVNVLGGVAENQINEIQYETRGRGLAAVDEDGSAVDLSALERVALYRAGFTWETPQATIDGFYRRGHYHWGAEGDWFGLYREAYYGENLDIYNGIAPIGVEVTGKDKLDGFAFAIGPQLWWGANPAALLRYGRKLGPVRATLTHQEDLGTLGSTVTLNVIPEQKHRATALVLETGSGPLGLQLGGIFAGTPKLGQSYRYTVDAAPSDEVTYADSGLHVLQDEIRLVDTLGGKARVTFEKGNFHAFAQGGYRGLVADSGGDPQMLFTGWTVGEAARGNHVHAAGGFAAYLKRWMVAPKVHWQKPLVGPLPAVQGNFDPDTGWYEASLVPRNVLADPFVVLDNRETTAFELLLAWDPTPATWMWNWDSEYREDAPFAFSTDFVYRIQPTSRDALLGFTEDGVLFAFSGAPPAANVWDVNSRFFINPRGDLGILIKTFVGQGQSAGDDPRMVFRYGARGELGYKAALFKAGVSIDDWGPYDYHRAFNQTFPLQLEAHASYGLRPPPLEGFTTRLGVEGRYRSLDEYSPQDPLGPTSSEWEIRSVLHVSL